MKILAIIPARGGSKGVPGKNKMLFDGKPLIIYSVEAALNCNSIYKIVVSSDDDEILEKSAISPKVFLHKRNAQIANDKSPVIQTILTVLELYGENEIDAVMLLQPTSPIRDSKDIEGAIKLFEQNPWANSLISVCEMDDIHPARMYWKEESKLEPIIEKMEELLRQDIPKAFFRNGSIYITKVKALKEHLKVMIKPSIGFEMATSRLLNIDSYRDVIIADSLIKAWKKGEI
jgi:CMP-N,N'-diacetyllegionaminic acid synthase